MQKNEPLAVLADIHGNSLALAAVLDDMRARGVSRAVNLGDIFYGPLDPAGTWELLKATPMATVLGNQDRILVQGGPEWAGVPTFQRVMAELPDEAKGWLRTLTGTLTLELDGRSVLLCHGTPTNDTAYLLEDISSGRAVQRDPAEVLADLADFAATADELARVIDENDGQPGLVLSGHSHNSGSMDLKGVTVFNPGSVGLPAYDDDTPPHVMQAGTPHARYGLVVATPGGWSVECVAVEYDWEGATRMAEAHGRADWAGWLRSGMAAKES